jgi:hypothetical protein
MSISCFSFWRIPLERFRCQIALLGFLQYREALILIFTLLRKIKAIYRQLQVFFGLGALYALGVIRYVDRQAIEKNTLTIWIKVSRLLLTLAL